MKERKAPVGSYPHAKVVKSFGELSAALAAQAVQGPPKPKPFAAPVDIERPLYAHKAAVHTSEMAKYLEAIAPQEELDDAIDF